MEFLYFNGTRLPRPDSYELNVSDILSDGSGETEAGTQQRDFKRRDVVTISLQFTVTKKWLSRFKGYRSMNQITVKYNRAGTLVTEEMYMDGYKEKLEHETAAGGVWSVSFSLKN